MDSARGDSREVKLKCGRVRVKLGLLHAGLTHPLGTIQVLNRTGHWYCDRKNEGTTKTIATTRDPARSPICMSSAGKDERFATTQEKRVQFTHQLPSTQQLSSKLSVSSAKRAEDKNVIVNVILSGGNLVLDALGDDRDV